MTSVISPNTPSELRYAIHTKVYTDNSSLFSQLNPPFKQNQMINSSPSLFEGLTPGAFGKIVKIQG